MVSVFGDLGCWCARVVEHMRLIKWIKLRWLMWRYERLFDKFPKETF